MFMQQLHMSIDVVHVNLFGFDKSGCTYLYLAIPLDYYRCEQFQLLTFTRMVDPCTKLTELVY